MKEAPKWPDADVLSPCMCPREIKELHREAANDLRVDGKAHAEMENLLNELEQLLVGIAIMQVAAANTCIPQEHLAICSDRS